MQGDRYGNPLPSMSCTDVPNFGLLNVDFLMPGRFMITPGAFPGSMSSALRGAVPGSGFARFALPPQPFHRFVEAVSSGSP